MPSQTNVDNDQTLTRMGLPMRRPGSKDKMGRTPRGTAIRTGEVKPRMHDQIKSRHASYPPMGNVHMNSGMPMPGGLQGAGGMPQGEEMTNEQGGGIY